MKSKFVQIQKAGKGRLKQAQSHVAAIDVLLLEIRQGEPVEKKMPKVRALLSELGQCIHEFNAYYNALDTLSRD